MKEGTFLVTHADDESAVLRDVTDAQVHTLAENPGVAAGEVVTAAIEPEPPMEVAWRVADLREQRTVPVERSDEPPTQQARELAAAQPVGELTRRVRAGDGELHVLTVPADETEAAAADVLDDEETVARAARLGVDRVEVRAVDGVVSVRYLP
ncbi:MAG: DUF5812 family protein [Haloarculaceae archaeon]